MGNDSQLAADRDDGRAGFIAGLPKAELHCHIEGTLEPELLLALAARNGVKVAWESADELRRAYQFTRLQDFLDIYYQGMQVLQTREDFYDLTAAYLARAAADNVRHSEVFFDPQAHTSRGVAFGDVVGGIADAFADARAEHGISGALIMCFLRHLSEDDALQTLRDAEPYRAQIIGVGLDSGERGNPPGKFARVFAAAREQGYLCVAHAGEEGPPDYIRGALDVLQVSRIDHGNAAAADEELLTRLAEEGVPLTMCPLSNLKLQVVADLRQHPLKKMLRRGLRVTVNSDDPAYFGGYVNANYEAVATALDLTREDLVRLARNSITASFADDARKEELLARLTPP